MPVTSLKLREGVTPRRRFKDHGLTSGWTLLCEGPEVPHKDFRLAALPIHHEGEDWISYEEAMRRAALLPGEEVGQHMLDFLLDHREAIPVELVGRDLLATGTRWLEPKQRTAWKEVDEVHQMQLIRMIVHGTAPEWTINSILARDEFSVGASTRILRLLSDDDDDDAAVVQVISGGGGTQLALTR